jgi:hypothetical protein
MNENPIQTIVVDYDKGKGERERALKDVYEGQEIDSVLNEISESLARIGVMDFDWEFLK